MRPTRWRWFALGVAGLSGVLCVAILGRQIVLAGPAMDPGKVAQLTPDVAHGQVLYLKRCAECHGRDGEGDGPREIPAVAAQRESYLLEQLIEFLDGERPGSEMHGTAMHDMLQPPDVNRSQSMRDITAYLAKAPGAGTVETGEGRSLELGRRAYGKYCSACHGADGGGSDSPATPRLGGQQFRYLRGRLRNLPQVHRGRVEAADTPGLSPEEQAAVADYLSRLAPASAPAP
jgi:cytochrome c553